MRTAVKAENETMEVMIMERTTNLRSLFATSTPPELREQGSPGGFDACTWHGVCAVLAIEANHSSMHT